MQNEEQIGRSDDPSAISPTNFKPDPRGNHPPQKGHPSKYLNVNLGGTSNSEVNPIKNVV